jgi:beta-catenin-like protein 1
MESELALHDQLEALSAVAANVQLYQHIVEHSTLVDTLTQLLGHENDDIAAIVVSIYLEWLDPTLLSDDPDLTSAVGTLASRVLMEAWETIVSDFGRFQATDDSNSSTSQDNMLKGIENSLSLMENLLDLDLMIPEGIVKQGSDSNHSAAAFMVKETKIVSWLVEQVEKEGVTVEFQGRCLELVSLLAQREDVHTILPDWSKLPMYPAASDKSQEPPFKKSKQPTTLDAIECMLQVIGRFRKTQPENESQTDLLENACIALSACITFSKINLNVFLDGQGIELVVRCLKERVHSGVSTLKLLDFVGHDTVHKQACERLVAAGGLKFLFPLFLGTRIPKPAPSYGNAAKVKREWLNAVETQVIRIFYCLSRHLDDNSADDAKSRFLAKFAQDETKCDRLVELLLHYDEKCRKAEYQFYRSDVEEVVHDEETIQLAALDAKLKGGGDLFHRLGALAAYLSVHSKRCHERILEQLRLQQSGITLVKIAVEEFISLLEEESSQREQLNSYLSKV